MSLGDHLGAAARATSPKVNKRSASVDVDAKNPKSPPGPGPITAYVLAYFCALHDVLCFDHSGHRGGFKSEYVPCPASFPPFDHVANVL